MRFVLSRELDCPPADAIRHARTSRLLHHVAAPWLRFEPADASGLPGTWVPGRYAVRLRLLGRLSCGRAWIDLRKIEQRGDRLLIHDAGSSDLAPGWDHRIEISPSRAGRTRYCDRVEIHAGWRTPVVWALAWLFFAHRQRRWRRLAAAEFRFPGEDTAGG
jgi:hypothetical protein